MKRHLAVGAHQCVIEHDSVLALYVGRVKAEFGLVSLVYGEQIDDVSACLHQALDKLEHQEVSCAADHIRASHAKAMAFLHTDLSGWDDELLSLGLLTLGGRECQAGLNLKSDRSNSPARTRDDLKRFGGVIDTWGWTSSAVCTPLEIHRRVGYWLIESAAQSSDGQVVLAFAEAAAIQHLTYLLRDTDLWERVRKVVVPTDISAQRNSTLGFRAADRIYREYDRIFPAPHSALTEAEGLRAAYLAAVSTAEICAEGGQR